MSLNTNFKHKHKIVTVVTVKGVTCDICSQDISNLQRLECHKLKFEKKHSVVHTSTTGQTPPVSDKFKIRQGIVSK